MQRIYSAIALARKIMLALKKLWLIANCDHGNCGRMIEWDDTTSITVCRKCGIVMQVVQCEAGKGSFTESCEIGRELLLLKQEAAR
jgi:hypothetical protein